MTPRTDADIPGWLAELGLPGLVDAHVHFMPQQVLDKVWAVFDRASQRYRNEWPITYRFDEQRRLAVLRGFGVRRFTSLFYAHKPGMARWLNGWGREFAARTPDCAHSATFFAEPEAGSYTVEAIEAGARVFKVHLEVGPFDPRDELLAPAWSAAQDAGSVLVVHCGNGPVPGPFTGAGPIGEVLARFPRLRLVVAHFGLPDYAEFVALAEKYEHVVLDTTMAGTDFSERGAPFPAALRPRARDLALAGKVVLGTDYPNIPYPYAHQLAGLPRLGFDDPETLAKVLWHNGNALLGG